MGYVSGTSSISENEEYIYKTINFDAMKIGEATKNPTKESICQLYADAELITSRKMVLT